MLKLKSSATYINLFTLKSSLIYSLVLWIYVMLSSSLLLIIYLIYLHINIKTYFFFSFSSIWFGLIESILLLFHFRRVANTTVFKWPWYTFVSCIQTIIKKSFLFLNSEEICLRSLIISLSFFLWCTSSSSYYYCYWQ